MPLTLVKGGTGLGLAICRSIVQHHGGQFGSSTLGEGTFFFCPYCGITSPQTEPEAIQLSQGILPDLVVLDWC